MSGDTQARKRRDKKKKKALEHMEGSSQKLHDFFQAERSGSIDSGTGTWMKGDDEEDEGTDEDLLFSKSNGHGHGGHHGNEAGTCGKLIFFVLFMALVAGSTMIYLELRGSKQVDLPISESRYSSILENFVEEHAGSDHEEAEHETSTQAHSDDEEGDDDHGGGGGGHQQQHHHDDDEDEEEGSEPDEPAVQVPEKVEEIIKQEEEPPNIEEVVEQTESRVESKVEVVETPQLESEDEDKVTEAPAPELTPTQQPEFDGDDDDDDVIDDEDVMTWDEQLEAERILLEEQQQASASYYGEQQDEEVTQEPEEEPETQQEEPPTDINEPLVEKEDVFQDFVDDVMNDAFDVFYQKESDDEAKASDNDGSYAKATITNEYDDAIRDQLDAAEDIHVVERDDEDFDF